MTVQYVLLLGEFELNILHKSVVKNSFVLIKNIYEVSVCHTNSPEMPTLKLWCYE